jgi:hypothetical protein
MAHDYRMVTWTPFKRAFDWVLALGVLTFLAAYVAAAITAQTPGQSFTPVQIALRATGSLAFGLLTLILAIGPLARFSDRFKPLL